MANRGLPDLTGITRVATAVLLATLALCLSCGAPRSSAEPFALVAVSGPVKVSATWLRTQPGESRDGFTFHLCDDEGIPVSDWDGLEVTGGVTAGGASFTITAGGPAADDIYLYVTYDGGAYALDMAEPAPGRTREYLFLAVPHRVTDVLALGLARTGAHRGTSAAAGPLIELDFGTGPERTYRRISQVNTDPRSVVELFVSDAGEEWVQLAWDERNPGDYNNNGLVEVSDLTPVGFYFEQQVSSAADPDAVDVVDGNQDGYITVSDLTPIGANYLDNVEGYGVYHSTGDVADLDGYDDLGLPTVERAAVMDATPTAEQKHRLHYTYQANVGVGSHHFFVRPVSVDGPAVYEGLASNTVSADIGPINLDPYWESTSGLTGAWGSGDGFAFTFGRALDYDGTVSAYTLSYVTADLELGQVGTVEEAIPAAVTTGDPPYQWDVAGLVRGESYRLRVIASDDQGAQTSPNAELTVRVPVTGVSAETWPYYRFDPARTGFNPASLLQEPLYLQTRIAQADEEVDQRINQPLLGSDFSVVFCTNAGVSGINIAETSETVSYGGNWPGDYWYAALDEGVLVAGLDSGLAVMDVDSVETVLLDYGAQTAPLLLGDYIYSAGADGVVRCTQYDTLVEEWSFTPEVSEPYVLPLLSDGDYIYSINSTGRLDRLDMLTGESLFHGTISDTPVGGSCALDAVSGLLYYATADAWLVEVDLDDLAVSRTWTDAAGSDPGRSAPALNLSHTPPLAFTVGVDHGLHAADLSTGGTAWTADPGIIVAEPYRTAVTCSSMRIFVTAGQSAPLCYDYDGVLRQLIGDAGQTYSDFVPGDGAAAHANGRWLEIFRPAETDEAPEWVDVVGVSEVVPGDGRVQVNWTYATDDHGEPVYYVIYYSAAQYPQLTAPYTGTTLITGIPTTGTEHSYWVEGLENGTRYYFAVRAYDGRWDDAPNIEANTNVLACTPPWQRTGFSVGGDEVYFMRGLEHGDEQLHLVYNDNDDGHLGWYIGNFPGGDPAQATWEFGEETLPFIFTQGFDPAWDPVEDNLVIASVADGAASLVSITLSGAGELHFPEPDPGVNPQVSIAIGNEAVYAYTEDVGTVPTEAHLDYYLKHTSGAVWQVTEPFEETNLSGRDLDVVLDPADGVSPWVALQRGGESAPNRPTPQEGECLYAWWDDVGAAWSYDTVDAGDNAPVSDCGKRVTQVLDAAGHPHLAYLDLNCSAAEPLGQLKYAWHDGTAWHVEMIEELELSFQTASLQFTYGELGLNLIDDGEGGTQPVIACLERRSGSASTGDPHLAVLGVWFRRTDGSWDEERLTDEEWVFPRDREPCLVMVTRDGSGVEYLNVFYATTDDQSVPDRADWITHYWREWNP